MGPMAEYMRRVALYIVGTAIVAAFALDQAHVPSSVAAPVALIISVLASWKMDQVSEQFKTDVERVLQPDRATMEQFLIVLLGVVVLTSGIGALVGAVLGVLTGLLLTYYAVHSLMEN